MNFWKKAGGMLFALALLIGLLPLSAAAAAVCEDGKHTPDLTTLYPANWNSVTGGYGYDYYKCKDCGSACHKNGKSAVLVGPDNGCSGGEKCHLPGAAQYPADFDVCNGGYQEPYYRCTHCDRAVDAQGTIIKRYEGAHTPGADLLNPDYIACVGGYQNSYYVCTVCGTPCNADGSTAEWIGPTAKHTPGGEKHDADYTACGGGFRKDWYECTVCGQPVDENGNLIEWTEPTAAHTPGGEKHPADYTLCGGCCKDPYYLCEVCGQAVNPALSWFAKWYEPTDPHTLTKMDALAPTYEADGNVEYWHCTVCGANFYDAKGEKPVEDMDDLLLPKLESRLQTSIKPGLSAVPASVAAQYPTVSDVKQALANAALTANTTLIGAEANSVLMDVTLQRQNPDGTLTPVSAEDFPAEGVEVLLPYPEGTDQTYTFVVTHMITAGAHAGEIEVLANTPEAGGIRVRFTSMSPVCITYQKPAAKPGTDDGKQPGADDAQKPAADTKKPGTTGKNQTGTTTTTTAVKTGDNANLALWGALLVLSALVLTCWLPKKKEQE